MRVDANEAWRKREEALRQIEALACDPHTEYVEQPMPANSPPADFLWLKECSPLPIVGDESYLHADDVALCAECFDGVNVKLCETGGISRAIEALQMSTRLIARMAPIAGNTAGLSSRAADRIRPERRPSIRPPASPSLDAHRTRVPAGIESVRGAATSPE